MAVLKLYSVKDVVVGHFKNPACFNNDNECIRAIKYSLNSINDLSRQCEDLQMWCLGEFDTETGVITSNVYMVANLIDYVNPEVYTAIKKPILKEVPVDEQDSDTGRA